MAPLDPHLVTSKYTSMGKMQGVGGGRVVAGKINADKNWD